MGEKSIKSLIGKQIQQARTDAGLTQEELAERLPAGPKPRHPQTVSDWENGKQNISLDRLNEIAEVLGVDPVVLLTLNTDDYRAAMEDAANVVEGTMKELVERLRSRSESDPGTTKMRSPRNSNEEQSA